MENNDESNSVATANNGSPMPVVIWADEMQSWQGTKGGFYEHKYHADYIVQRLEAEVSSLVRVLEKFTKTIDYTEDGYDLLQAEAKKLLQKHKDK